MSQRIRQGVAWPAARCIPEGYNSRKGNQMKKRLSDMSRAKVLGPGLLEGLAGEKIQQWAAAVRDVPG